MDAERPLTGERLLGCTAFAFAVDRSRVRVRPNPSASVFAFAGGASADDASSALTAESRRMIFDSGGDEGAAAGAFVTGAAAGAFVTGAAAGAFVFAGSRVRASVGPNFEGPTSVEGGGG